MPDGPERCWYCLRARAVLWCDYMLGAYLGSPEQLPLQVDRTDWRRQLAEPHMYSADFGALLMDLRTGTIATCDAAACLACAQRYGWKRVGHINMRPKHESIDHCHVHAGLGLGLGLGETGWVGGPAIDLLRSDVRAACVRRTFAVAGGAT